MSIVELHPVTERTVFIHPGYVKTATSTLQRHIFAKHPQIHFLGRHSPVSDLEWAVRHICQADSVYFEPERLQRLLSGYLETVSTKQIIVVSYEAYALYESTDKGLIAHRLKQLFPAGRILFTIRRQQDLVRSWYLQRLRHAIRRKSFVPFEEWYWLAAREPWQSILDDLRYTRTIDFYVRLFGRKRVQVFLFEELVRDPAKFGLAMASFLGVNGEPFIAALENRRENTSMSQSYFNFWRHCGHFLPRKLVRKWSTRMNDHGGPSALIELPEAIDQHIAALVADDNLRLAETFGLNLASCGYSLRCPIEPEHSLTRASGMRTR